MTRRFPLAIKHIMFNLRGGFLVRPLCIALALGFSGGLLSWMEEIYPSTSGWVPVLLFPSKSDPQIAQIILSNVATSIMTVVSIVFAILLMSLTLASMQFSPRIIVSFTRDKVTQWTLGLFLGTFSYCIAALPAARSLPYAFAPVLTVCGAMLLVVACVVGLLFFIHHISRAISVNYIVDRIAWETELVIDELMPEPFEQKLWPVGAAITQNSSMETSVRSAAAGYICFIDTPRLVRLAKHYQIKVKVHKRVGQFVAAGIPLILVSRKDRLTPEIGASLLSTIDLGPVRTLEQDVEFGALQIVDIALKAMSPAVNDPTTAISCVDQLSRIVGHFAARKLPSVHYYDPPGVIRVSIPWLDFESLLESAFEQIRYYARADLAVSLRLLRALNDIAAIAAHDGVHQPLLELGQRVIRSFSDHQDERSIDRLRGRLKDLETMARRPHETESIA
jgi:uncharacterized membrane protein